MTNKELQEVKDKLIKRLTYEAGLIYASKDTDSMLKISGIARSIKVIKDFKL